MSTKDLEAMVEANKDLFDPRWPGIEFGPGWTDLFARLLAHCRESKAPAITKSKEKLATLRLYFRDQAHPAAREIRDEAMRRSGHICEVCGDEGRLFVVAPGFIATRCDAHNRN